MLYLGMRRKCCISAAACRIFALSQVLPQEALSPSELKNDMFRSERLEIDVPIRYHYSLQCKNNDKKQINFDMCGRFDSRFICRIHF